VVWIDTKISRFLKGILPGLRRQRFEIVYHRIGFGLVRENSLEQVVRAAVMQEKDALAPPIAERYETPDHWQFPA
jgi:hypothetical protein